MLDLMNFIISTDISQKKIIICEIQVSLDNRNSAKRPNKIISNFNCP